MAIFEEREKKTENEHFLRHQTNQNKRFMDQNLKINRRIEKEKILAPKKVESERIQLNTLKRQILERNKSGPNQKYRNSKKSSLSSKTRSSSTLEKRRWKRATRTSTQRWGFNITNSLRS